MAQVIINETGDFEALMVQLDVAVRSKYAKAAVRKAGTVVARDVRKRVPQSRKTGTASKQSNKTKRKRAGGTELKKTIKVVVREYEGATLAVVGSTWPEGAHMHLIDQGHKLVAWGRETGARIPGKKIFAAAVDTTIHEQQRVAIQTLKDGIAAEGG